MLTGPLARVRQILAALAACNRRRISRRYAAGTTSIDSSGEPLSLEDYLRETDTDGFIVLQRGRILFERYANGKSA